MEVGPEIEYWKGTPITGGGYLSSPLEMVADTNWDCKEELGGNRNVKFAWQKRKDTHVVRRLKKLVSFMANK